jgi:ligand-binding sensor domain-containing protein
MTLRLLVVACVVLLFVHPARAERLPVRVYAAVDGLGTNQIHCVCPDSRGFLWFCTSDGIARFDGVRFTTYGVERGLSHPSVNAMLESPAGVYWIATNGGGICRFAPGEAGATGSPAPFTVYRLGETAWANRVNVLYRDRAGHLWAGTDGGLFELEMRLGRAVFRPVLTAEPTMLPGEVLEIHALAEDREGTLWIATITGLFRRSPDGHLSHLPDIDSGRG